MGRWDWAAGKKWERKDRGRGEIVGLGRKQREKEGGFVIWNKNKSDSNSKSN
jgi:hypothetical protein